MTAELRVKVIGALRSYRPELWADWEYAVWAMRATCRRCRAGIMLADSEDWPRPVCHDCYEDVGENPRWHEVDRD